MDTAPGLGLGRVTCRFFANRHSLRRWLVASRQSCDADWFGCIPITCLGRTNYVSCEVLFQWELMAKYEIMVLACQVGPFHLTLTQINLEMNCISKNKCPESQKLDTRCRGENATLHVSRATTCVFLHLCLWFIPCDTRKASENLSFWNSLILSNVCVVSITPRLDNFQ